MRRACRAWADLADSSGDEELTYQSSAQSSGDSGATPNLERICGKISIAHESQQQQQQQLQHHTQQSSSNSDLASSRNCDTDFSSSSTGNSWAAQLQLQKIPSCRRNDTLDPSEWSNNDGASEDSSFESYERELDVERFGHPGVLEHDGEVPLDEEGRPTSMGSALHATGRCVPCLFYHRSMGCSNGTRCTFCHFYHPSKPKSRPCKDKRARVSKNLVFIKDRIRKAIDEGHEDLGGLVAELMASLPPSVHSNERFRKKIQMQITKFAQDIRSEKQQLALGIPDVYRTSYAGSEMLPAATSSSVDNQDSISRDQRTRPRGSRGGKNRARASTKTSL